MDLDTSIDKLPSIGPILRARLKRLNIFTIRDLLFHIPFRYENYILQAEIRSVQPGEIVTIKGTVEEIKNQYITRFRTIQKARINDGTGILNVTWFNQPFLVKNIKKGDLISLSGKIDTYKSLPILESPEYEILESPDSPTIHTGCLVPIYPETRGLSSKWLRRIISKILRIQTENLFEYIPYSIIKNNDFMGFIEALEQIHFPKTLENAVRARQRLAFNEFFLAQLAAIIRRNSWKKSLIGKPFHISKFKQEIADFWKKLPFELTRAQKRATQEIFADLASRHPMNRLLEGDVGSGKTVVASVVMYVSFLNGFKSILMAPTEILVQQHYTTISNLLSPFGVKVDLLTGSSRKEKRKMENDILVGTHALIYNNIDFKNIGLIVIDEQQRFGVEQRAIVRRKGKNPHFLTMTATPIPRTVALVLYGDLDLSFLDEMPGGRKKVKTWLVPPEKRENAYAWISNELRTHNSQAFVICPFIEESETLTTVRAATKEYEELKNNKFKTFRVGLLHGRLKSQEKNKVINDFHEGKLDILVATPVVEVGIDIPNATIILIEAAERFGLSQLHQLRGRVGRRDKQSYCLLFTDSKSKYSIKRLRAMEKIYIGAELAELDLKLRGPGEMYGTRQHGIQNFKVASFSDLKTLELARSEAQNLYPKLSNYPLLQQRIKNYTIQAVEPD